MTRQVFLIVASLAMASIGSASTPIANVSSRQPISIDGRSLSVPGVASWPVVVGDDIQLSTAPGTVLFKDGSRVLLSAGARAKILGTEKQPKIILVAGSLDYTLAPSSKVIVSSTLLEAAAASDSVRKDSNKVLASAVVVAGGAAAVTTPLLINAGSAASTGGVAASGSISASSVASSSLSSGPTANLLPRLPPVSHFQ